MTASPSPDRPRIANGRGVRAILGPTNTGKTHLAIERMAAHHSGLIGLPLRLLAREVYQRLCEKVGAANTALITGEEKIAPPGARYLVCTVEAMPPHSDAAFVAIDEVQLAADLERGHIFTDRILNLRGREETMLLGAATAEPVLRQLLPGIEVISRPRMSMLHWAGSKKITRLPPRSAIVAFSANEVYAIAELIRRQRGGAAVVLGSLSPRTRNAQVALYQSGDVDFLVATDAIGMGLNLDVNHVAFAQDRKFDGLQYRRLTPSEMAQIAGRAGRHTSNGTFGITGQVTGFEDELVERLETHNFDPAKVFIWRNGELDFSSLEALSASLAEPSRSRLLMKGVPGTDALALETLGRDEEIAALADREDMIRQLWEVCLIPDYRRISPGAHAEILRVVYLQLAREGSIDEDWFSRNVARADRTDGDIDALSARIAQVRTWTYLSHRADWMKHATHWQERTRDVEDRLSDALHEALTKRFIDRRTSVLMKRLRENTHMEAQIDENGAVSVEGHPVGTLSGFRFMPEVTGQTPEAKAASAAALKALAAEIERRANRVSAAPNTDFVLSSDGTLRWIGAPVARLSAGSEPLKPNLILLADEQLTGPAREAVAARLQRWVTNHVAVVLKPLVGLTSDQTLDGMARGFAFRLVENLGNIERQAVASDVVGLDQDMRAGLRRHGVRFGAYTIFIPALLKPAPAELLCLLWAIHAGRTDAPGISEVPAILASGRTSALHDPRYEAEAWRLCGYRILGAKAVRIDILERLADLIRPALSWKPGATPIPDGAVDGRSFIVTPGMMSILGATHEDMDLVLKSLGYRGETRQAGDVSLPENPAAPEMATASVAVPATEGAQKVEAGAQNEAGESSDMAVAEGPGGLAGDEQTVPDATAAAGASDATAKEAAPAEDPTPATVTLWRPAGRSGGRKHDDNRGNRGSRGNRGRQDDREANRGGPQADRPHKHAKQHRTGKHEARPRRQEREPDPDSPFAKLAALKQEMAKPGGK